MLVDAIIDRMHENPDLVLLVVTKPIDEWIDPGCQWTYETNLRLQQEFPFRYRTFQLRSFDTVVTWGIDETESRFENIDLHAKLMIVDDEFLSVGSCNKNNRGLIYEGELNLAVLDRDWVTAQRRRVFANLLPDHMPPTDEVGIWWNQFAQAASWNDAVSANWDQEGGDIDLGDGTDPLPPAYSPQGLVYSLSFGVVDDCLIEGVGPDMVH
jgi:phosphatidylserine/phosphatidylglycerophosphate/cardiolipin synthase-like enzyme